METVSGHMINAYVAYNGLESDPPVNMVTIDYLFDFTNLL
jgi:hypothetical protein